MPLHPSRLVATDANSPEPGALRVRVNDELVLDAGRYETVFGADGPVHLIHPAETKLFEQVIAYLKSKPDPVPGSTRVPRYREGVAAAAVALRWGSYLAVLVDADKPRWRVPESAEVSRISNGEMARINIEASAALADWLEIALGDGATYRQLVGRALAYLPMPKVVQIARPFDFGALDDRAEAAKLIASLPVARVEEARAQTVEHPTRVVANAFIHCAWRNGPVEKVHAGAFRGYPVDKRRIGVTSERRLMAFASARLTDAIRICRSLESERPPRPWAEQILPFGLAEELRITPERWTLTESTREVRLPVIGDRPGRRRAAPSEPA
jgi:hypothetical protein